MNTFVDLHAIHTVPFTNLNRDRSGRPKQAEVGGAVRARWSSQTLKRAMRRHMEGEAGLAGSIRTREIADHVHAALVVTRGWQADEAWQAVYAAFTGILALQTIGGDLGSPSTAAQDDDSASSEEAGGRVGHWWVADAVDRAVDIIDDTDTRAELVAAGHDLLGDITIADGHATPSNKPTAKHLGTLAKSKPLALIAEELAALLAERSPVMQLMGRFLTRKEDWAADDPTFDGALDVIHALTTHEADIESDFFTAVDDLSDGSGAMHPGVAQYTSGTFYRYATIDVGTLRSNLGAVGVDPAQERDLIKAAIAAFVLAEPTGKQHAAASHTLPTLVAVSIRHRPIDYWPAFDQPVRQDWEHPDGLAVQSINRLNKQAGAINRALPTAVGHWHTNLAIDEVDTDSLGQAVDSFDELAGTVIDALPEVAAS